MAIEKRDMRNKFCPTDEDYKKIEEMAGYGMTIEMIGGIFGVNKRTIERHAKDNVELKGAIERGRAKASFEIQRTAYNMAKSGEVPAMTMFWLKTRCNWKETSVHEHRAEKLEELIGASMESETPKAIEAVNKQLDDD